MKSMLLHSFIDNLYVVFLTVLDEPLLDQYKKEMFELNNIHKKKYP